MDNPHLQRRIRQALLTDRLMGMDSVPIPVRPVVIDISDQNPAPASPAPPISSATPTAPPTPKLPMANPTTPQQKQQCLDEINTKEVHGCTLCGLCQGRTNTVFGQGSPDADLMFIGEGPGADEDAQGLPFVGRAGQLLNKQIDAMGLQREDVYIANTVKCRPPGNRAPTPAEAQVCMGQFLYRQIEIIRPKVIVALGGVAAKFLMDDPKLAITRRRGQWETFRGIDLMLTFHPAYLLRQYTPDNRRKVWNDLKMVMEKLGMTPPD